MSPARKARKLNGWLLAVAAMIAPAAMFAGSSASAEPPRETRDAVDEAPDACTNTFCTTAANCRAVCGIGWACTAQHRCFEI